MFLRQLRISKLLKRFLGTCGKDFSVKSLKFNQYGSPTDVLKICNDELYPRTPNQVLVKILASPIHPIDINLIKGERAGTAKEDEHNFPLIPGIECVAEVIALGNNVTTFQTGDRVVVPYADGRGTWSTHAVYNVHDLSPIPLQMPLAEAAMLTVNPCTAYRILSDFVKLNVGDCVLLNGSNTALGESIHQLCNAWKLNSVGLLSDRANSMEIKNHIKGLGATEVMTLDELQENNIFETGKLPKPRLTLSCIARSSSRVLGNYLDEKGVMVTYGIMAGQPVATATTALIFQDCVHRPFWMTRWSKFNPDIDERKKMLTELCCLIENNQFKAPDTELVPFDEYKKALYAMEEYSNPKAKSFVLDMR